jgi:CheY-like chemotaxis protein
MASQPFAGFQPIGHTMSVQIQDPLLFLLLGSAFGLMVGVAAGLAVGLVVWRRLDSKQTTPDATPRRANSPLRAPTPRVVAATTAMAAAAKPPRSQVADLLLVDDSAVARAKLRKLFEGAGYQVHLACDGVEALALLQQGRYALMVTDLEMPNMDGVTLINTCLAQRETKGMPILAVTGHDHLRAKFNECRDIAGVHRKPWVDDILLSHVAALVTKSDTRAPAMAV